MKLFVIFILIVTNNFLNAKEWTWQTEKEKNSNKIEFNVVHKECKRKKMVALTFDDGVVPATSNILDILKKHKIRATFFVVGRTLEIDPMYHKVLKRMLNDQHTIGSHTYNHADLTQIWTEGIKEELKRTGEAIEKACGERPRFLRPPYGNINAEVFKITDSLGYRIVNWNVDTKDWQTSYDSQLIIDSLYQREDDDSSKIVLMHDRPFTVQVLESVIKFYEKKGFNFVNMEKCLGIEGYF